MRLIDADAFRRELDNHWPFTKEEQSKHGIADMAKSTLLVVMNNMPTIDAVPVVRCKDCKHKVTTEDGEYNPHDIVCDYWESDGFEETDFCSCGEGRTDE